MGTLFLVATPIGNLEDISARALKTLIASRLIAAEDTRHTRKLLNHFKIQTPLTSYHEHNKLTKLDYLLTILAEGDIALVSDAGTPALNDPGYELVKAVLQAGYPVSPIPGPSAPIAALVASGLPTNNFLYLGYLPRKKGARCNILAEIAELAYTLVFLETPHRLLAALQDILDVLGERQIAVARELTKIHEEIFRGSLSEALAHFTAQAPRGEFTLIVAGKPITSEIWDEDKLESAIQDYKTKDMKASQIAAVLADQSGWPRREIYERIAQKKQQ
ncbi:16S rRNA (cytidine(1402)-2'-O)-methyltransferase [Chloroflexota bacterium]